MNLVLENILSEYRKLELDKVQDFTRFNQYAITHHSTAIEGSTLTLTETELLLSEGITPSGKPLQHSLMVKDHEAALLYTLKVAGKHNPISVELLRSINALVMKNTGSVYETALGRIEAGKGEFRKGNVHAGGSYFVNYDKVEPLTKRLVEGINDKLPKCVSDEDKINLSFVGHFDLVTIHPWYDGNGRTSRLLMNYIQQYYHLPLSVVYPQDKAAYIDSLKQSGKEETTAPFLFFMQQQYIKQLSNTISQYKKDISPDRSFGNGLGFSIIF